MVDRPDTVSRMAKALAPFAMGLFGVFIVAMPVRFFDDLIPMPIIPLAVIFFWTLHDPGRLPSSSVFLIGLFQDCVTGTPIGLWSTVYLLVQFVVLSQRSYFLGRDFQVVWMGFGLAASGAAIVIWVIMSLMSGVQLPVVPLVFQLAATILFYPVLGQTFKGLRRRVLMEV